jgi:hypothetical protein
MIRSATDDAVTATAVFPASRIIDGTVGGGSTGSIGPVQPLISQVLPVIERAGAKKGCAARFFDVRARLVHLRECQTVVCSILANATYRWRAGWSKGLGVGG